MQKSVIGSIREVDFTLKTLSLSRIANKNESPTFFCDENNQIELQLFLEAIYLKYGYDFRNYSRGTLERRILNRMTILNLKSVSQLMSKVLRDPKLLNSLILDLSIGVTEMFRDPSSFLALRKEVLPLLKPYDSINVWVAGCCTGEEAYSMAILLKEEGLGEKSRVYATDLNETSLEIAMRGAYCPEKIKQYTQNYQNSGGRESFVNYYRVEKGFAVMEPELKSMILFAPHNLATDQAFSEIHLILCRNVLIYFNNDLKTRVFDLFFQSLVLQGLLNLGMKESQIAPLQSNKFQGFDVSHRIFRKQN